MKNILHVGLTALTFWVGVARAESLDDIAQFSLAVCDNIAVHGSVESSDIQAEIEGKVLTKSLAKLLGASVGANGELRVKSERYEGLPYESLPAQMADDRQCRKELVKLLLSERNKIRELASSSTQSRYVLQSAGHRIMLMKKPDWVAYNDIFNQNSLHIKLLLEGTKVDVLEAATIESADVPLSWYKIEIIDGPDAGLTG